MHYRYLFMTVTVLLGFVTMALPVAAQTYVNVSVQPGDTLAKIAGRYCASWQEVYNINLQTIGSDPGRVEVGQVLTVPNRCGAAPSQPVAPTQPAGVYDRGAISQATGTLNGPYYTVAWGDDLYAIGQRFGVAAVTIMQANGLSGTTLDVGQTLTIPGLSAPVVAPTPPPPPPDPNQIQRRHFAHGECNINLQANTNTYFTPQGNPSGVLGGGGYMALEVLHSGSTIWYNLAVPSTLPGWIRSDGSSYSSRGNCSL